MMNSNCKCLEAELTIPVYDTKIITNVYEPDISVDIVEIEVGADYEGEYEVYPSAINCCILPTDHKILDDNIIVHEIQTYEVSNPYGTTINIGG